MIKDVELCLGAGSVPFESAERVLADMRAAERMGHWATTTSWRWSRRSSSARD